MIVLYIGVVIFFYLSAYSAIMEILPQLYFMGVWDFVMENLPTLLAVGVVIWIIESFESFIKKRKICFWGSVSFIGNILKGLVIVTNVLGCIYLIRAIGIVLFELEAGFSLHLILAYYMQDGLRWSIIGEMIDKIRALFVDKKAEPTVSTDKSQKENIVTEGGKYCIGCGTQLDKSAVFCHICGKKCEEEQKDVL